MRLLDLFAGLGGISKGFEPYGCYPVWANDIEPKVKPLYDANHSIELTLGDIWSFDPLELPEYDILLGGFPCQPFSVTGLRKGFADERGNLFFAIANIIEKTQPKAFLLENVKGLISHDGGNTLKVILDILENKLGYNTYWKVLNSKTYGNVPQNRERIYIVGFKDNPFFTFPHPIPLTIEPKDIREDNVPQKYYDKRARIADVAAPLLETDNHVLSYRDYDIFRNGYFPCLTAHMGAHGSSIPIIKDSKGVRNITPREMARLQGLSDSFIFPDTLIDRHIYKAIGNGVTVTVIERIVKQLLKALGVL